MLTKANAIGYAILSLVVSHLNDEEVREINIEPYLNGRESGFAVHFWGGFQYKKNLYDRKFVFCRERRSDEISVYESNTAGFNMTGNGLTEDIYRNQKGFDHDQILAAVDYIVDRLKEEKTPA